MLTVCANCKYENLIPITSGDFTNNCGFCKILVDDKSGECYRSGWETKLNLYRLYKQNLVTTKIWLRTESSICLIVE